MRGEAAAASARIEAVLFRAEGAACEGSLGVEVVVEVIVEFSCGIVRIVFVCRREALVRAAPAARGRLPRRGHTTGVRPGPPIRSSEGPGHTPRTLLGCRPVQEAFSQPGPAIGVAGNHHHGVVSGNRAQDGVHATLVN